ncbi:Nucleoporin Nup37 [Microtus ochrogaster]|uniref:Nucleoporin Nup37 n=1 Tax=Microtus ochrogaster TaxID=79684 RepID=A0A8J6GS93_MICOH|nr:Nucleoporin Nup37 [Microtus ochrogaster]
MKQDATRNAAYTVDCEDYVHVVEFNPFESGDSGNLIAYGGSNYVVIGLCTFQEEEADIEGIQYKTLRTFHHGVRVDGIAWSPETKLDSLPPVIKFCTSAADMKIRLFTSDLQDKNEYKVLEGHSDFINDLVFHPKEGHEIASVSDDHTCRIWNLEGKQTAHFLLHSPGMSVCWHPEEAFKLMVAEKNGTIRFYDLMAQQAILSLQSEQTPLMSAHWCLKNTFKVGAVAGNDWIIWDITRSRWSAISENLFATTGYPGKMTSQFQIHHLGHSQVPAIQQKRTVAFLNQFVVHTVQFLNRFSTVCEEKLADLSLRIQQIETTLNILDAKLSSIPGLEDVTVEVSPASVTAVPSGSHSESPSEQPQQDSAQDSRPQESEVPSENVVTVARDPRYARYLKMVQVPLPAVNVGLGKRAFHYLRAEHLQVRIKDVHKEVLPRGPGEAGEPDVVFPLDSNKVELLSRLVDTQTLSI